MRCRTTSPQQEGWHALHAQVLSACVRCPGGDCLTNDNVIDIFHACFRIGHYQTERSKDMSGAHVFAVPSNKCLQIQPPSWTFKQRCRAVCKAGKVMSNLPRRRPSAAYQVVHRHFLVTAELLTQASRQIMLELIEIIFQRLGALAPVPLSPQGAGRAEVSCCCALAAPAALCRLLSRAMSQFHPLTRCSILP